MLSHPRPCQKYLIYLSIFYELTPRFCEQNATQKSQNIFVHVPSEIAAHEVEEIGM